MINPEKLPLQLAQLEKPEASAILAQLTGSERKLFQTLFYFFPEEVSTHTLKSLEEFQSLFSGRKGLPPIDTIIESINSKLEVRSNSFIIVSSRLGYRLEKREPLNLNPNIWAAFSKYQRALLAKILASEVDSQLRHSNLQVLKAKLDFTGLGTIANKKHGKPYVVIPSSHIRNSELLKHLRAFQEKYDLSPTVPEITSEE